MAVHVQRSIYNIMLPLVVAAARVAAPFNKKIAGGLEGRKGIKERWQTKASELDRKAPLVWFHVSSVGEFEQAKPVMNLLAERMVSDLAIALTFFSPSGMNYLKRHDRSKRIPSVKFIDYLPPDTIRNVRYCLDTLKPEMIVYVKFDLWPNLIIEASERGIPQVLVSGTLSPTSHRLSRIARAFYGDLYSRLNAIAAISDEDAERFRKDAHGNLEVVTAGDTRFDQVCRRIDTSTVKLPSVLLEDERSFLIAGSTWPRDEEIVIPGFSMLLQQFSKVGLIIVPHEPTSNRLGEITRALEREHLPFTLLSSLNEAESIDVPVVVADGVGYLAELYKTGCVAYVGGSFTTGVHNVMEPAVFGLPVLFGPRIDNSYEARKLLEIGVGTIVQTPGDFKQEVGTLLSDRELLQKRGEKGSQFIRNHCGAAEHCVHLIEKYLKMDC